MHSLTQLEIFKNTESKHFASESLQLPVIHEVSQFPPFRTKPKILIWPIFKPPPNITFLWNIISEVSGYTF